MIFAISSFILEIGISTLSDLMRIALRTLVNMSAIGSVSIHLPPFGPFSPTRLYHTRYLTLKCECSETNPANAILAYIRPWPPAQLAPVVSPYLKLRRPFCFFDHAKFRHVLLRLSYYFEVPVFRFSLSVPEHDTTRGRQQKTALIPERHTKITQKGFALFIRLR